MNNNQRINQLLMQTRGLSSTNLAGTALIEQLRKEAFALSAWACREIDRITDERDEARREVCVAREALIRLMTHGNVAVPQEAMHQAAQARGWDCFKENTNG
jgi:hypothetical protein